jgi:branched-chain amino acid transport system substrate-binding protein
MKIYFTLILLSCVIFQFCGCDKHEPEVTPSGRVVRVGVIAPMSGPDEKSGESALLGIQTALQMQPYLDNGDKIELAVEDNGGNGEQTLTAMQKLKDDESVSGVLLMGKSDVVLPLVPVADTFRIPVLALIATHPGITENNHFISQLSFDDVFQGDVAALYARDELLISRTAVFSEPGNAHYRFLAQEFIRKFTSVGGEIIRHVTTEPGQEDLHEIVNNLRDKNVELLYLVVRPEQVIRIVRAIRATGWKPKLVGSDGLGSAILLQHKNDIELVRGMMVTDFYNIDLPETQYGRTA